jgi:hypothetical protein
VVRDAANRHNELTPLEREGILIRADVGVLEIFVLGSIDSRRFGSDPADQPLYEMLRKTPHCTTHLAVVHQTGRRADLPAFFTDIAQSCDRQIAPPAN